MYPKANYHLVSLLSRAFDVLNCYQLKTIFEYLRLFLRNPHTSRDGISDYAWLLYLAFI